MEKLNYGENVVWFLNELAATESQDMDSGDFDVCGENKNGVEGWATIDVTLLAADAAEMISALQAKVNALKDKVLSERDIDYICLLAADIHYTSTEEAAQEVIDRIRLRLEGDRGGE